MSPQEIQRQLAHMKGKKFVYNGKEHIIKDYKINASLAEFSVRSSAYSSPIHRKFNGAQQFFDSFVSVSKAKQNPVSPQNDDSPTVNDIRHKPSSVIIYSTIEYSKFNMLNGNRSINNRKVNKIIKEINNGNDMLQYYPIQVKQNGERLDILDGQHRFFISKKLNRPVYYILVLEKKSMPEIAMVNSNVEKWRQSDFLNCYIQQGNENYKILKAFIDEFDISIGMTLKLMYYGNPRVEGTDPLVVNLFHQGNYEVKYKDEAIAFAKECKQFDFFKNWTDRGFLIAIYRIKSAQLIPIEELLSAVRKRPEMLTPQKSYKEYVWNLEQIVNVGRQKRIVIV